MTTGRQIAIAAALTLGAAWATLGVMIVDTMPPNAVLMLHAADGVYASPPCAWKGQVSREYLDKTPDGYKPKIGVRVTTQAKINATYRRDDICRDANGFIDGPKSGLLDYLGLLRSRWNPDGTWRW